MRSVLFVCTANICRSPMAVGLWREKISASEEEWLVESAGTWTVADEPAAPKTQLVLQQRGIDVSSHRSRMVDQAMLRRFNLILTMESGQKEALRAEFPEIAQRVYTITEMAGMSHNIHDPFGSSLIEYQDTLRELDFILTRGFDKIVRLAGGEPA